MRYGSRGRVVDHITCPTFHYKEKVFGIIWHYVSGIKFNKCETCQ